MNIRMKLMFGVISEYTLLHMAITVAWVGVRGGGLENLEYFELSKLLFLVLTGGEIGKKEIN